MGDTELRTQSGGQSVEDSEWRTQSVGDTEWRTQSVGDTEWGTGASELREHGGQRGVGQRVWKTRGGQARTQLMA